MRIAIYGAGGMVGSRLATEALRRGHEVTGITRTGSGVPEGVTSLIGDAGDPDLAKSVAAEHEVLVSSIPPSRTGGDHQLYLDALRTLAENLGDARLFVIGGAGSLVANGKRLVDSPGFAAEAMAEARTAVRGLEYFRGLGEGIDWTFLSPAPVIAPGERTATYTKGLDSPVGQTISAEDFAVAVLDELETPAHRRLRFTVAN
jgi:uncharacterized protein